jgi:hypothetical protein
VQVQSHVIVGLHGSPPFANLFFVLKGTAPGDFIKLSLKQSKSWTFYMIISACIFVFSKP